jgi:putative redox protein
MSLEEALSDYKEEIIPVNKGRITWDRELIFNGLTQRGYDLDFDADIQWGCMPVEALLLSVGGCMAIDVVSILQKMRCPPEAFSVDIEGERKPKPPQYYTKIRMVLRLTGEGLAEDKVARAVSLSREKYCSVYHSLRPDIEYEIEYRINEEAAPAEG